VLPCIIYVFSTLGLVYSAGSPLETKLVSRARARTARHTYPLSSNKTDVCSPVQEGGGRRGHSAAAVDEVLARVLCRMSCSAISLFFPSSCFPLSLLFPSPSSSRIFACRMLMNSDLLMTSRLAAAA
jgi:hypothetical protein